MEMDVQEFKLSLSKTKITPYAWLTEDITQNWKRFVRSGKSPPRTDDILVSRSMLHVVYFGQMRNKEEAKMIVSEWLSGLAMWSRWLSISL